MIIGIDASRSFVKDPAGPEYYSQNLLQNIAKIDKKNHYILYLRPEQKPTFKLPHNFEARNIKMRYLWTQVGLAKETILRPPDVLFIPAHTLPLLTRVICPNLPVVVTVHGLEGKFLPQSSSFLAHIYRNWSIGWAVRFADKLIAVSNDTKEDIEKSYQNTSKKIKIVHEGVDFRRFSKGFSLKREILAKKYGIDGKYVLFVGTIQPRKNLIRLMESFALLIHKSVLPAPKSKISATTANHFSSQNGNTGSNKGFSNLNLKLVIAGKPGWLYEDILATPRRLGIEDRVIFVGRINDKDLPHFYKGAELFVLPSVTEGFGLPILEAQASGIPVVCSSTGALPEVAGEGAVLVNPLSIDSIKEGMEKVLLDKQLRTNLTRKGKENSKGLSWENTAYNTVKVLTEVARQK